MKIEPKKEEEKDENRGWLEPPLGPRGWSGHPKKAKKNKKQKWVLDFWGWSGPGVGL
jgi:hypothetical protein